MPNAVAIVPAYNEAPRIAAVLSTLSEAAKEGVIKSIIAVDDGSQDGTSAIAASYHSRKSARKMRPR